jgi:hypothetical protein
MTDRELMQQALYVFDLFYESGFDREDCFAVIKALRERLAQPEFPTHEEGDDGWSDWVCPDPKGYLMKCCDCGLVHEAQFGVVRYKSEAEREDCEPVDDLNLQAVFRMRRSEQWTPKDTAYRPGGMAQPEQKPVAWRWKERINNDFDSWVISASEPPPYAIEQQPLYTAPRQWQGLTDEEIINVIHPLTMADMADEATDYEIARAIEAKLKEKNG